MGATGSNGLGVIHGGAAVYGRTARLEAHWQSSFLFKICYRWEPEHGEINLISRGSYHVDISQIRHHPEVVLSAISGRPL